MSLKESKWDYMGGYTSKEGKGKWYNFIVISRNKRNNYFKAKQKLVVKLAAMSYLIRRGWHVSYPIRRGWYMVRGRIEGNCVITFSLEVGKLFKTKNKQTWV